MPSLPPWVVDGWFFSLHRSWEQEAGEKESIAFPTTSDTDVKSDTAITPAAAAAQRPNRKPKDAISSKIEEKRQYVARLAPEDPDLARELYYLANAYHDHYQRTQQLPDLDAAIRFNDAAVAGTFAGHNGLAARQGSLAHLHTTRFSHTGNLADLDAAFRYANLAVKSTASWNFGDMRTNLGVLAIAHRARYRRFGAVEDLRAALECKKQALAYTDEDHPNYADSQATLAVSYIEYYKRFGKIGDLETALDLAKSAVDNTDPKDCDLGMKHGNLAVAYTERFRRLGDMADLDLALVHDQAALDATPPGHPNLSHYQAAIAVSYTERYKRLGMLEDMESALKYDQAAVENTLEGHPNLASLHGNLAASYSERYSRLGSLNDLKTALHFFKSCVDKTLTDHVDLPGRHALLAECHLDLYSRLGELSDLDSALYHYKYASDRTPLGDTSYARRLSGLGVLYCSRYERLNSLDDLEAAFKYQKAGLEYCPADHPELISFHRGIAKSYRYLYIRHRRISDLEESLRFYKSVLDKTPPGHVNLATHHVNLSNAYKTRYNRLEDSKDLELALEHGNMAVDITPRNHPKLPSRHQTLSSLYYVQYKASEILEDLTLAIHYGKRAVRSTPAKHPLLAKYQSHLLNLYNTKYQLLGNKEDYEICAKLTGMIIKSASTSTVSSWRAVTSVASFAFDNNLPVALEAYSAAFNMLSELLWIGTNVSTRHYTLVKHDIQGITSRAIACALHFNDINSAVEYMEQGLSIVHQQSLQLKNENSNLWRDYPEIAAKLRDVSTQVQHIDSGDDMNEEKNPPNYIAATLERQKLIAEIRAYPGYSDFLQPASYKRLSYAAAEGPVILLNFTSSRSDAIIILKPEISPVHVPLPGVTPKLAQKTLDLMRQALRAVRILSRDASQEASRYGRPLKSKQPPKDEKFQEVLLWLWNLVVQPVFQALHKHDVQGGRVWWCTSGPFNYLPLHAAAPIGSLFIQSYTTSLHELIRARTKPEIKPTTCAVVGVSNVAGHPELLLPLVPQELQRVATVLGSATNQLLDSAASVSNVLEVMKNSSWLHLACHGKQDTEDPLKSHLMLNDGNLELAAILNNSKNLASAEFIFLSACETAMGDEKLANEAMHFTGSFIAAGFKSAVGTLWSMADSDGPRVAEMMYRKVCEQGNGPEVGLAAEGLHRAVESLRRQGVPAHRWIPFVHFGV
ncbi:hypothetical protein H0H81_008616 [Sphagnurus paluster]|uniref:CHAT domain-containing protein n=1 Tax=Sphagnurus paluster TaxID=117069 RepID=A0A9P7FS23_9AGAR|nr:hypothetical protein H0H81_008616 [Sphagnurus paluster]